MISGKCLDTCNQFCVLDLHALNQELLALSFFCENIKNMPENYYCDYTGKDFEAGFTLIELLVSIFIFAIVISMVYGTYRTILTSSETVRHGDVPFEQGRNAMERMTADLEGLYVSHEAEFNLLKKEGKPDPYAVRLERSGLSGGSFSSLRFVSSAHVSFGGEAGSSESGPVNSEISWYVVSTPDGKYELRRSDRLFPDGKALRSPRDPVLCRNITRFEIQAVDASGNIQEQWDSEAGSGYGELPASFVILLESSDSNGRALLKTSVPVKPQRMKNLAEPDITGIPAGSGTTVTTGTNAKKESPASEKK
jgi:general secretion pathway protein J